MIDQNTAVLEKEFFQYLIRFEIKRAMRYQSFATLLFLEPDQEFDNGMNLKIFAEIISEELRDSDIIGRVNHVRFGIVLLHADQRGSLVAGERLRKRIKNYLFPGNKERTVSMGGACFPNNATNPEYLIVIAEQMLKTARNQGGNALCFSPKENQL